MSATISQRSALRSNSLDGGRPVHPVIAHLEGHVEQLFAEKDDVKFFVRGVEVETAIEHAMHRAELILDSAATFADAVHASSILRHVAKIAARLAKEQRDRACRLMNVIIPEVQRCYEYAEAGFGGAAQA